MKAKFFSTPAEFFNEQAPYYKRLMIFRTMSAKKEETQIRRLDQLIELSAKGERMGLPTSKPKK